jgi:hypothetical protein
MPRTVQCCKTAKIMMTNGKPLAAFALVLLSSTSAGELSHNEALVFQRYPGSQLLEVELDDDDDRLIYDIQLLANGAVRELELDAASGAVLEYELED